MLPLCQSPRIVKKEKNRAVFKIEALYPGYGVTIGNSLRRVLYSSLSGAAITQVKIKGVHHQFSTIPYVLEDVLNICLNLKQIRFKMHSDIPQFAKFKIKGETKVRAGSFELPLQVEIVNKNAHIATLTDKKAELEMEIKIEKGLGYEPVEQRRKSRAKLEIGQIPLDAIFTPIKRVKYSVENMRVGERTDFDRLILEIETDGTILPEQAFVQACEVLINHFNLLSQAFKKEEKKKKLVPKKSDKKVSPKKRPTDKKKTTKKKSQS